MSLRAPNKSLWRRVILGAIAGHFAGKAAPQGAPTPEVSSNRTTGCLGCAGVVLVLALLGFALDRFGCIATERGLRESVHLSLVSIEVQSEKNIAWVQFEMQNTSKWPVSASVTAEAFNTTKPQPVAANSVEMLNVPARATATGRIGLELAQMRLGGIENPRDPDLCEMRVRIAWVSEVGKEQWQRNR